ncbi:MAG: porin [Candidatus Thiodiazotropha sp. (ex Lucinoma aequizonata)]|nr:porin [Candidatus Thiodiazotropha sp. (ex Lucinoma aequizonata)]MCU7888206.1 porin [Candidatus Thiodiazotropha sp. (ex Lucinoma aequizonata)]MCU7894570.1 porin [Candidatus Thiodiazotropha sp. (ex Lucinoma aequizonata)]MCU7900372.1 porin [Candidatus Thiodiazotropha sp. (ex Lucinoma aequizonata)]MCU7902793.1 porin [Candidatus Thiodiazotropha sp. (ex Lucinoma aequizonata)]
MKKALSLAIAAALVAPAAAMADATLFGKAHFIVENVGVQPASDAVTTEAWGVDSIHSRVGLKGSEDLGGGFKALYHFEFKVHQDDSADGFGDRNQFIGLASDYGTALLGRHDTPMKMAQGKFDQFGDLPNGDITSVIPGEDRIDNLIAYVSPAIDGLTFVGALVSGELGDSDGQPGKLEGLADHTSLAAMYNNGPIFASLAYNTYDLGAVADADLSLFRGTIVWNDGMWQVGAMFASMDVDKLMDLNDVDSYGVSGHIKVGNGKIKGQFLTSDAPPINTGAFGMSPAVRITAGVNQVDQYSFGYEHNLSKRTIAHVGYTTFDESVSGKEVDALFGGLIHNF